MLENFVGTQGHFVLTRIKNSLVVIRPNGISGNFFDFVGKDFACFQILDLNVVDSPSNNVDAENGQFIVGTDAQTSQLEIRMSFCHFVAIEHDFFFGRKAFLFSGINGVVFSGFESGDVVITIVQIRNRLVVFLNPALHFLEQFLLECLGVGSHFFVIVIFLVQIINHFRIFPVVQPKVIVNSLVAEFFQFFGNYFGNWWLYYFWHILGFQIK